MTYAVKMQLRAPRRRSSRRAAVAEDGLVCVVRDRYLEWRRRRAWSRLKEWEELDRRRGELPPMEEYRWNMRGEWLRRRVERWERRRGAARSRRGK